MTHAQTVIIIPEVLIEHFLSCQLSNYIYDSNQEKVWYPVKSPT